MEWGKSGENDWVTTTPSGSKALYEGPRFAFVDPPPDATINQRFAVNFDLSFSHRLTLSKPGLATGALSPETSFDRLAAWTRYAVEPQAGHSDFDRRMHVALDATEAGHALIAQPEARRLVLELFDLGVKRITADRKGLKAKLLYAPSPAMDGGNALSAIAARLDALANVWPSAAPANWRFPRLNGKTLALAWGAGWLAAIIGPAWLLSEHGAYQIERLGHVDWIGMAALLAAIILPTALLAARRADAHRILGTVVLGALLTLPLSGALRIVEVNRLEAWDERAVPAEIVDFLESDAGGFAVVVIDDRQMQWPLTSDQAILAREGRLCASGTTVEGLRGLRYVNSLKVWPCRRLDDVEGLPPTSP